MIMKLKSATLGSLVPREKVEQVRDAIERGVPLTDAGKSGRGKGGSGGEPPKSVMGLEVFLKAGAESVISFYDAWLKVRKAERVIALNKQIEDYMFGDADKTILFSAFPCWTGTLVAFTTQDAPLTKELHYLDPTGLKYILEVPLHYRGAHNALLIIEHPFYELVKKDNKIWVFSPSIKVIDRFYGVSGCREPENIDRDHVIPIGRPQLEIGPSGPGKNLVLANEPGPFIGPAIRDANSPNSIFLLHKPSCGIIVTNEIIHVSTKRGAKHASLVDESEQAEPETNSAEDQEFLNVQFLLACKNNSQEDAEALLQDGADINAKSKLEGGDTALMLAVRDQNPDLVKFLLSKGADPNLQNDAGETAHTCARAVQNPEIAKMIEDASISKEEPTINEMKPPSFDPEK